MRDVNCSYDLQLDQTMRTRKIIIIIISAALHYSTVQLASSLEGCSSRGDVTAKQTHPDQSEAEGKGPDARQRLTTH